MDAPVVVALITAATSVGGALGGLVGARRTRAATARKDEADAANTLAGTVAELGLQVRALYQQLATTEARASAAEARASAAEARAAVAEGLVAALSREVDRHRAALALLPPEME